MRLRWTLTAIEELKAQIRHIQKDKPRSALKVAKKVKAKISDLKAFPETGRPGEEPGTRELIVSPYVVVYRIREGVIELLHVFHGAQDR